jgi:hypothetical protein
MPSVKLAPADFARFDVSIDFNISVQLVPLKKHFSKAQLNDPILTVDPEPRARVPGYSRAHSRDARLAGARAPGALWQLPEV